MAHKLLAVLRSLPAYAMVVLSDVFKAQKKWSKAEPLLKSAIEMSLQICGQITVMALYPMQSLEGVDKETGKVNELVALRNRRTCS